jgi:hypothetical protein
MRNKRTIKGTLLAVIVTAVLCAGTVSARQVQKKSTVFPACTGTCSATKHCGGVCICEILSGTSGACVRDPGPVRPPTKPIE